MFTAMKRRLRTMRGLPPAPNDAPSGAVLTIAGVPHNLDATAVRLPDENGVAVWKFSAPPGVRLHPGDDAFVSFARVPPRTEVLLDFPAADVSRPKPE